jgi:transposase
MLLAQQTEEEPMCEKRNRRRWTDQKKLKLVLESMNGDAKIADICRREGLSPNMLHQWRKQLLGAAEAVFGRKAKSSAQSNGQAERQKAELDRMKSVIAEITAENLDLKKTLCD